MHPDLREDFYRNFKAEEKARKIIAGQEKLNDSSTDWQPQSDGTSKMVLCFSLAGDGVVVQEIKETLTQSYSQVSIQDRTLHGFADENKRGQFSLPGTGSAEIIVIEIPTAELQTIQSAVVGKGK